MNAVEIEKWAQFTGLKGTMGRTAKHLLPGRKFKFVLNVGGGSYTDGKTVVVGIPELVYPMDKKIVFSATKALVGHETEHVASSDFDVFVKFQKEVKTYFKVNHNLNITPKLGAHLLNSTEDGRIEKRLINRYRGYKKHIQLLNGIFWTHQPCKGKNEMMDFLYSLTTLCVTGLKSKEWDTYYKGSEADRLLDQIKPFIMKAINNPTARGCADDTMEIAETIAPYMARMLEDLKNQREMESLSDKPGFESNTPNEGGSSQPGNSQSSHFLEPEEDEDKEKGQGDAEEDKDGKGKDENEEEQEGEKEEEGKDKAEEKESGRDGEDGEDENGVDGEDGEDGESDKNQDAPENTEEVDEEEKSASPEEKTKPTDEEIEQFMEEMVANLQDEIAEEAEKAMEQGQKEAEREFAQEEKENKFTGHLVSEDMKGLDPKVIFRQLDPITNRTYDMPHEVLKRGRILNKELKAVFLNKQVFNSHNRRSGQLDTNNLWKKGINDYNMFVKKGTPKDTSYAINVLVDASGSMRDKIDAQGTTKLDKATEATAMIEEALRGLVPVRITHFTAGWGQVLHSTVKDFDQTSKDTLSWKRLPAFSSLANQDGYSINIATRELLKRTEKKKILIVLSDGLPTEPSEREGQKEVQVAVREARKAGVIVIAIAFGSKVEMENNKSVYKAMYQNGIMMVQPDEIHRYLSKTIQTEIDS